MMTSTSGYFTLSIKGKEIFDDGFIEHLQSVSITEHVNQGSKVQVRFEAPDELPATLGVVAMCLGEVMSAKLYGPKMSKPRELAMVVRKVSWERSIGKSRSFTVQGEDIFQSMGYQRSPNQVKMQDRLFIDKSVSQIITAICKNWKFECDVQTDQLQFDRINFERYVIKKDPSDYMLLRELCRLIQYTMYAVVVNGKPKLVFRPASEVATGTVELKGADCIRSVNVATGLDAAISAVILQHTDPETDKVTVGKVTEKDAIAAAAGSGMSKAEAYSKAFKNPTVEEVRNATTGTRFGSLKYEAIAMLRGAERDLLKGNLTTDFNAEAAPGARLLVEDMGKPFVPADEKGFHIESVTHMYGPDGFKTDIAFRSDVI